MKKALDLTNKILYILALVSLAFLFAFTHVHGLLSGELWKGVRIFTLVASLLILIINIKRIRITEYVIFLFTYLCICIIQTYNIYPSSFNEFPFDILLPLCMAMLCLVPIKDGDLDRLKTFEIVEVFVIVLVLIIDVLSIEEIFNGIRSGVTENENYIGNLNACIFVIATNFVLLKRNKLIKFISAFILMLAIWFMALSSSRGAYLVILAYVLALSVLLIVKNYSKYKKQINISLAIIAIVIVLCLIVGAKYLFDNGIGVKNLIRKLLTGRYEIWFTAFPLYMKGHWMLGNGIGTMYHVNETRLLYSEIGAQGMRYHIFHNFILDTFYHGGIIGVIILIIGIIMLTKYIKKEIDFSDSKNKIYVVSMISLLATYFFDFLFLWDYTIVFFLILGSLLSNRKQSNEKI